MGEGGGVGGMGEGGGREGGGGSGGGEGGGGGGGSGGGGEGGGGGGGCGGGEGYGAQAESEKGVQPATVNALHLVHWLRHPPSDTPSSLLYVPIAHPRHSPTEMQLVFSSSSGAGQLQPVR